MLDTKPSLLVDEETCMKSLAAWLKNQEILRKKATLCIRVEKKEISRLENASSSNGTVELVVLSDVGPRVVRYVFFWRTRESISRMDGQAEQLWWHGFRLYGGHRLVPGRKLSAPLSPPSSVCE